MSNRRKEERTDVGWVHTEWPQESRLEKRLAPDPLELATSS